jgi:hypothetical protein
MTHHHQLMLALDKGMRKQAFIGNFAGMFGKGLMQSGKRFMSTLGRTRGYGNQALGYLTGNAERVGRGVQHAAQHARPKVPGAQVNGAWYNPRAQAQALPQRFRNTGQRLSNFWGASEAGAKGFGQHAAYAAGRLPAMATYGGALTFAPYVAGNYAGSAHGAMAARPDLENIGYDEMAKTMEGWGNSNFGQRMRMAHNPQGFAEGMLSQGDGLDPHTINAYQRMFDPNYQRTGVWDGVKEVGMNLMPAGMFMRRGGDPESPDFSRNFIERYGAGQMADQTQSMLPFKSASVGALAMRGAGALAGGAGRAAVPGAGAFFRKAMGAAALPAGMIGLGYGMSKQKTQNDMYAQARGTARAAMANQWMNMNPMMRYGAAMFPTAARMRMESQLGPGYRSYYNQVYGAPGQQTPAPQMPQQPPQTGMMYGQGMQ